jgi:predicted RNA binding protein YcfA (HicA-like mRNA interferase family)
MACWNIGGSGDAAIMPKKIRELVADMLDAGFLERGGKGSHRNFVHPKVTKPVTLSGRLGDDAKKYQERAVRMAIEESKS